MSNVIVHDKGCDCGLETLGQILADVMEEVVGR